MSNQLSILTEINWMWQVTEAFKSIVKNITEFFSPFFFSLQPRRGGRRRGSCSLTRQNSEHQSSASVKRTSGQQQWYSAPSPEEEGTTTSMQYSTRAYWYCLDNPVLTLCNAALCFARDTNSVTCKTIHHWQKQHVLVRLTVPTAIPDLILWWNHLFMRTLRSENWCDTKVNRQSEG